ncbi:acyltransferase [Profundibacter sp.]
MTTEIPTRTGLETTLSEGVAIRNEPFVTCKGKGNRLIIGKEAAIGAGGRLKLEFLGNGNTISIGANCQIKRGHYRFVGDNMNITVGDKTTINGAYVLCMEGASVAMGEDCMLSYDIEIRTSDAHSILSSETGKRINQAKDVVLGDHVWVGKEALLMPGARVASNSIVGTRALVTGIFEEENVAIVGVPARVVSTNRTWDRALLS